MLPYYSFKKAELASFATNRKLQVQSTAKYSKEPTRSDLIQALKHADTVCTFNFLDLPPELRTNIYKELLVLQNSFTCHPQILQTCKLINEEASNLLYGDNLIEVKVYEDGVYVHGVRAGNYATDYFWTRYLPNAGLATRFIEWPQFIRRAQFMRLTVISYVSQYSQIVRQVRPQLGPICFVLHSFCSFLRTQHRLRSLEVDVSELQTLFTSVNTSQQYHEDISTALYPLRLLPKIKKLRVEGISEELSFLMPSKSTTEVSNKIVSGVTSHILEQIKLARLTCQELTTNNGVFWHINSGIMADFPAKFTTYGFYDSGKLLKAFLRAVELVRIAWDRRMEEVPTDECKKRVRDLVQLDVEVKLAMNQ